MIDIKLLRKDKAQFEAKLKTKEPSTDLSPLLALKPSNSEFEAKSAAKATTNEQSQKIGEYKRQGKDVTEMMNSVSASAEEIHTTDNQITLLELQLQEQISSSPQPPHEHPPKISATSKDNVVIKKLAKSLVLLLF